MLKVVVPFTPLPRWSFEYDRGVLTLDSEKIFKNELVFCFDGLYMPCRISTGIPFRRKSCTCIEIISKGGWGFWNGAFYPTWTFPVDKMSSTSFTFFWGEEILFFFEVFAWYHPFLLWEERLPHSTTSLLISKCWLLCHRTIWQRRLLWWNFLSEDRAMVLYDAWFHRQYRYPFLVQKNTLPNGSSNFEMWMRWWGILLHSSHCFHFHRHKSRVQALCLHL